MTDIVTNLGSLGIEHLQRQRRRWCSTPSRPPTASSCCSSCASTSSSASPTSSGTPSGSTTPASPTRDRLGRATSKTCSGPRSSAGPPSMTKLEAAHALSDAGIAASPCQSSAEVRVDPHLTARNMLVEMERTDGVEQPVLIPGNPVKLSEVAEGPETRIPWVGEHTDEVLAAELGLDDDELARAGEGRRDHRPARRVVDPQRRPLTWQPPPRPDWVRRGATRATSPPSPTSPQLPLRPRRAPRRGAATLASTVGIDGHGIDGFGDDDFLEPLAVLLAALEEEAELTVLGRWITRRFLLRLLRGARADGRLRRAPTLGARRGDRPSPSSSPARPARARPSSTRCSRRTRPAACPRDGSCCVRCPPPDPAVVPRRRRVSPSPTASCACMASARHASTPSTSTAGACTRSACRRCRSCSARRSSPRATTCRSYVNWLGDVRHDTGVRVAPARAPGAAAAVHETRAGSLKSPVHLHSLPTLLAELSRRRASSSRIAIP